MIRYLLMGVLTGVVVLYLLAAPWWLTTIGVVVLVTTIAIGATIVARRHSLDRHPVNIKPW